MKKTLVVLAVFWVCGIGHSFAGEMEQLFRNPIKKWSPTQEVVTLKITMAPGEESKPHKHHAYVYVYVLEGTIGMQVQGQELQVLRAGDTFYESPGDIHTVGKNMSNSEPASFLAFMVKAEDAPLTIPVEQ